MANFQEVPKKCFCARCFLPVDVNDRVDIDGQNFHRMCSTCCICRTIPTSLKMFYGHVFCSNCFKNHVMSRFKGDAPQIYTNNWWMQWAPGVRNEERNKAAEEPKSPTQSEEQCKRSICARCLQAVCNNNKVEIGSQCFHPQCAKCCFCQIVPRDNVKIYYGQVFCEDCFHKHVMNRSNDGPAEFFKNCFEQWQTNAQFAETMRQMMAGSSCTPFVFMMQPPYRCGNAPEWTQSTDTRKSVTPALSLGDESLGTSLKNRTDVSTSGSYESATERSAAEKIEKLTKYLHERSTNIPEKEKKWKSFDKCWVDLQDPRIDMSCPKCLWQCGTIYINSELLQNVV